MLNFFKVIQVVFISLFLFLSGPWAVAEQALSKQQIVLITSLNTSSISTWFLKKYYRDYVPNLEYLFLKRFADSKYSVRIVRDADQFDLWQVLHDPVNVAVFWLSHAGSASGNVPGGLIQSNTIVDSRGYDLTPIFEKIHPNLKFLAVIGCFSKEVIETLPQMSHDPANPDHPGLSLFTFNKKIDARRGLKLAINRAKDLLAAPKIRSGYTSVCPKRPGYWLKATRKVLFQDHIIEHRLGISPIHPAARLMARQEVFGVFPYVSYDEREQSAEFFMPANLSAMGSGGLTSLAFAVGENAAFQADFNLAKTLDLGEITFEWAGSPASPLDLWSLWKDPRGYPIGVTSHSYILSRDAALKATLPLTEASDFVCDPMPSY